MNKLSKIDSPKVDVSYLDLANKYYEANQAIVSSYVAKVANDYAANSNKARLTLLARIYNFFNAMTENGYNAWTKTDKTPYI
jgi:hypothetical protein